MAANSCSLRQQTRDVLSKVVDVNAHIHRVSLSANRVMASRLYRTFMKKAHKVKWEGPGDWYKKKAVLWTHYGKLVLFYKKPRATMPDVKIETADSNPKLFRLIANIAPGVLVSSVEYSVDLIVEDYKAVAGVFWALRRNAYSPSWTGEILLIGEAFNDWNDSPELNRVHKVYRAGTNRTIKFYERGYNEMRKKGLDNIPFWWRNTLNRVRVEVTVGRSDQINGKKVLGGIPEFIDNPGILDVVDQNIHFKSFKGANALPREFDLYETLDDSGHEQCFQAEFRNAKELVQNPWQYLHDLSCMTRFREHMLDAAKKADREWKAGIAKPVK